MISAIVVKRGTTMKLRKPGWELDICVVVLSQRKEIGRLFSFSMSP
jgi:hypothetical protein